MTGLVDALTGYPRMGEMPDLIVIAVRIVVATCLCGIIGLERELTKSTAGIRTNMLVGLAASTLALTGLSLIAIPGPPGDDELLRYDPIRVIEAVSAGVAFLGAGVVVFSKGDVRGLTTGASIWASAAIGVASGFGMLGIATIATLTGVTALVVIRRVEFRAGLKGHSDDNPQRDER